jgi:hypothetical protein
MTRFTLVPVVVAAAALAAVPDAATGCAAVPHRDQRVETAEETALIVWDEQTKTEHFVRRASFRSTGYDFGFLVPTPNRPAMDVAGDDLFGELSTVTAPKVEYREQVIEVERGLSFGCFDAKMASKMDTGDAAPAARAGGVDVLEQKRVGDYDATVLAFRRGDGDGPETGAKALAEWLARHGYESPPAIERWLAKYVADGWCVTAFKIAAPEKPETNKSPAGRRDLRAKPVRMSFKAERPFYPYREPEIEPGTQPAGEARLLRVFVAAKGRVAGTLGDGSKEWPGQTAWSGPLDAARWTSLFGKAKLTDPPAKDTRPAVPPPPADAGYWLTEFEDRSSPRPGTDEVYFVPSADASAVERPTKVITSTRTVMVTPWWHAVVYAGVPVALVLGGIGLWRVLRRA